MRSSHVPRQRLVLLFAVALAVAVAVALVVTYFQNRGDPGLRALRSLPAYSLTYPEATLLAHVEAPSTLAQGGTHGAYIINVFGVPRSTSATYDQVLAWYSQRLQAQGWVQDAENLGLWHRQCATVSIDGRLSRFMHVPQQTVTPTDWLRNYSLTFEVAFDQTC